MRRSVVTSTGIVALVVALMSAQQGAPDLRKAGEQAYLFAYPMVLLDAWRSATGGVGPSNTLAHRREIPTDKNRGGGAPNADTLYSAAWLELSKEPVLLHVPDTRGRYYLMQLVDAWGETVSAPGKRTTGTGEGWFAFVGPGWNGTLPEGASRIDVPTNTAYLLGRILTNGAADYANVHALQRQFWLVPLSRYPRGGEISPPLSREISIPLHQTVAGMSTAEFFTLFAKLLAGNPPHAGDSAIAAQLAALGIEAGKPFPVDRLDPSFEQGVAISKEMLGNLAKSVGLLGRPGVTGWRAFTGVGRYGVNYATRAAMARVGVIATLPEDNTYMSCRQDGSGRPLEGTRNYVTHFDKATLPPVRAFWSVTLYDAGNFVANPLNRYAIGDRDALKFNPDGSLDLYIQHESPGAAQQTNWLPSPAGQFSLAFRLYWPEESVLNGEWIPPAVTARGPGS